MSKEVDHICVCVCTYKRPQCLQRLLKELAGQATNGRFTFSIVVADNDELQSARAAVSEFAAQGSVPIQYCVEPQQGIARARNKAIENASGDFIALIDDDEFPAKDWLLTLFNTCEDYHVDGVLGPVKRHFDGEPPNWLVKSDFYERPVQRTGTVVKWFEARSGNVLLNHHILETGELPFRPQFRVGEDQDFFRRMIEKGHRFIWSADAVAYEVVPPVRWKPTYMLRKALLRGASARLQPTFGAMSVGKSLVAAVVYTLALPFALLLGYHRFMTLLVSLFDHLGKLLAFVGINPIKEQYVTD
jgi:glycosyltransferase involved in cell wall biosynthesis